jgi:hypothetical protein
VAVGFCFELHLAAELDRKRLLRWMPTREWSQSDMFGWFASSLRRCKRNGTLRRSCARQREPAHFELLLCCHGLQFSPQAKEGFGQTLGRPRSQMGCKIDELGIDYQARYLEFPLPGRKACTVLFVQSGVHQASMQKHHDEV